MNRVKTSIRGVSSSLMFSVCVVVGFFMPHETVAQCATGTLKTVSYPSTLSLTGSGGNTYSFTVPQWNYPAGYTLLAAVFSSKVSTTGTATFTNTTGSEVFFTPQLVRTDVIKVNGTTLTGAGGNPFNGYPFTDLQANPTPGYQATYGPQTVFSQKMLYDSITTAATLASTYTGSGNISVNYITSFSMNNKPLTVSLATTISDQVAFNVTYYYCDPTVLAANIVSFTAFKKDAAHTLLKWAVENEHPGRSYYIQVGEGGSDFVDVGSEPSTTQGSSADYSYTYSNLPGATGKVYFRIKQVDIGGSISYSNVCVVDMGANGNAAFAIFPNPVVSGNYISLSLPGDTRSWQVDIFAADGGVIQRNLFSNTSIATVNFNHKMPAGTYFVRATNPLNGDSHTGSFVVTP